MRTGKSRGQRVKYGAIVMARFSMLRFPSTPAGRRWDIARRSFWARWLYSNIVA